MSRSDWNSFQHQSLPGGFAIKDSTVVAVGGSVRSLFISASSWSLNDMYGFMYNGGDLENGSVSVALRSLNGLGLQSSIAGLFARGQINPTDGGTISSAQRQFYTVGTLFDDTISATVMRCYRVQDTFFTQQGANWIVPIVDNNFVQFEFQTETSGSNVILRRRHNAGFTITPPGSTGWTSWIEIATDTNPGTLINPGKFGIINNNGAGFNGGTNTNYWDNFNATIGV